MIITDSCLKPLELQKLVFLQHHGKHPFIFIISVVKASNIPSVIASILRNHGLVHNSNLSSEFVTFLPYSFIPHEINQPHRLAGQNTSAVASF
jgi:hypothetical protein